MTVAVRTREGSTSAVPVTMPGASFRTQSTMPCSPGRPGPDAAGAGPFQVRSFPRSAGVPLRDLWKATVQVSSDLSFMPESDRSGVRDDAEPSNRSQQQSTAYPEKCGGRVSLGDVGDNVCIAGS